MQTHMILLIRKQGKPVRVRYFASSALPSMLLPGKQGAERYLCHFLHRLVGNTSQTQKSHFV